jgi:hypothetical protein
VNKGLACRKQRRPVPYAQHLQETTSGGVHIKDPTLSCAPFTLLFIVFGVSGRIVRVVMPIKGRGVVEKVGRLSEKGTASDRKPNRVVAFQIKVVGNRRPPGKTLSMPSGEGFLCRFEIEIRESIRPFSNKGFQKALFFTQGSHAVEADMDSAGLAKRHVAMLW